MATKAETFKTLLGMNGYDGVPTQDVRNDDMPFEMVIQKRLIPSKAGDQQTDGGLTQNDLHVIGRLAERSFLEVYAIEKERPVWMRPFSQTDERGVLFYCCPVICLEQMDRKLKACYDQVVMSAGFLKADKDMAWWAGVLGVIREDLLYALDNGLTRTKATAVRNIVHLMGVVYDIKKNVLFYSSELDVNVKGDPREVAHLPGEIQQLHKKLGELFMAACAVEGVPA